MLMIQKNDQFYTKQYGVKSRSIPYIHDTFVSMYRDYPFIKHILKFMRKRAFNYANDDETSINIMLQTAKANHTLCKYDPYGLIYIEKYEQRQNTPVCLLDCDEVYLIFSDQKDSSVSKNILERLHKFDL